MPRIVNDEPIAAIMPDGTRIDRWDERLRAAGARAVYPEVQDSIAEISWRGARDVADFLSREIDGKCPIPNRVEWMEVINALYALTNDTDAIMLRKDSQPDAS